MTMVSTAQKTAVAPSFWRIGLGLILLGALGVGAVYLAAAVVHVFQGLQKEVAASLVAGVATVVVGLISLLGGRYYARRQDIEQSIRAEKIPMYEEFLDAFLRFLGRDNPGAPPFTDEQLQDAVREFTRKLMVWGSDEVVRQWSMYRRQVVAPAGSAEAVRAMFSFETLLKEIRKEFGHRNKGIDTGTLLGLFINDIGDYV